MKKFQLILHDEEEVELNFSKFIQILGGNGEKTHSIVTEIAKYFSKYRYLDSECHIDNKNIRIDGEIIGRNYFNTIYVKTIDDIEENLNSSKSSALYEYLEGLIQDIDISKSVDKLNNEIQNLVNFFNEKIDIESLKINISNIDYNFNDLLKNNLKVVINDEKYQYIKYFPNIKKIKSFLEILVKNNERFPDRWLVIFENIDSYISKDEYRSIVKDIMEINNTTDIHFIITISKDGYVALDENTIESINVINNNIVFNVSNLEMLHSYVEEHYPYYRQFDKEEFIRKMIPIMNKIGDCESLLDVSSFVILKIINNSEDIQTNSIETANPIELKYIQKEL